MGFFSRFAVVAVVGIGVLLAVLYDMTRQEGLIKPRQQRSSAIAQKQKRKSEEQASATEGTLNAALPQTEQQVSRNQPPAVTADADVNIQQNNPAQKDDATKPPQHKSASGKQPAVPTYHTVKRGETLAGIARRYFGDWRLWRAIAYVNNIKRVGDLRVGQEIRIPALKVHKVQVGETLYTICQNHKRENRLEIALGELMKRVAEINGIEPSKLRAGQVIALPLK